MAQSYTCRGLRKWCNRRCDTSVSTQPIGYPQDGYYCPLHSYQKPRRGPDGSFVFESEKIEEHVRRRTSFVAPEALVAGDMVKVPGMLKDRAGAKQTVSGDAIFSWLMERKGFDEATARAYGQRMVLWDILLPVNFDEKMFSEDKSALYRVVPAGASK